QWYGRQSVWGGAEDWGYRIGYGHRGGSDYETGDDFELPSSYKSRDWNVSLGADLSADSSVEFTYLRLDQTDVEFPGLVFDINFLVTDAYQVTYVLRDQPYFDQLVVEGWYNRTRFEGDTSRSGKNRQIPVLRTLFDLGPDQFLTTDVDASSAGYRLAMSWGDGPCCPVLTVGTDLIYLKQELNDIVPARTVPLPFPPFGFDLPDQNFPIPESYSADVGVFVEHVLPASDRLTITSGARVDFVSTSAVDETAGLGLLDGFPPVLVPTPLSELKQAGLDQHFTLWAIYGTAEFALNDCWTILAGAGHAQRPPTMTELYAAGPFIGSLNPGLTFVQGDPELDPERRTQIDIGARANYDRFRGSAHAFYAWVRDYITFDDVGEFKELFPPFEPGQDLQDVAFTNTDLATLAGFELAGEVDLNCWLTGFALMSYIEGRDRSREEPSRIAAIERERILGISDAPRSIVAGSDHEPLPLIPPLEARLGLRLHEPCPLPRWAVELEARIVDDQDRVARSLFEQQTPGFTVWNLRSYWQARENLLVWAGVENFTDKFYREHLDFRSGRGVFRPGVNVYFGSEVVY
ncbi:MAG TPA: TonB-dependent receptor, partial [Planctomycetaceae bacterium]|nr:TonB-dependent receptor [Planctomycetaceae bacterium]